MSTHLYTDLLTPEEKASRGKPIKKVAGMLPLDKMKVSQMRHVNEVELLRKIQAGLKGKKNVSFKVNGGDPNNGNLKK